MFSLEMSIRGDFITLKLCQDKFKLNIRKKFFLERIAKHTKRGKDAPICIQEGQGNIQRIQLNVFYLNSIWKTFPNP